MKRKSDKVITFPNLDEWGTPTTKMPNCPECGEDELGVIHEELVMCYSCGWEQRKGPLPPRLQH